jgi:hypothetical protein
MTRERFEDLAEIYGGDIARWPAAERDAAALLMAAEPDFAKAALAAPADLDALLDAWTPLPVSYQLREALIASAPANRARGGVRGWFWRAGLGAGLAAACAAGLVVGVRLSDAAAAQEDTVSAALGGYDDLSDVVTGEGA